MVSENIFEAYPIKLTAPVAREFLAASAEGINRRLAQTPYNLGSTWKSQPSADQYGEKRTFAGVGCKDCRDAFDQVRILRHATCGTQSPARNVGRRTQGFCREPWLASDPSPRRTPDRILQRREPAR